MSRYVIIGTGAAGIGAAEAIRCLDSKGNIFLIGDEPQGYYSRPGLAYFLTGELPSEQLYPFTDKDFRRLNLQRIQARVARILPGIRRVELDKGMRLDYDRLLIATGARAAGVQVPGVQAQGVVKLDNFEDASGILKLARKARAAVVVGGGITALEIVEGLRARGVKTHYFLRGDRYWSNVLDETESRIVEHRLWEDGVQINFHTELSEILTRHGRVDAALTKDGRRIKCEIVAIAIGVLPRKELAEGCGLKIDRGILVNEYMQTNRADIYAAGDVAQVYDPVTGKFVLDSLWDPARNQGIAAGMNMAGQETPYYKLIPFNVTRLAGLTTTIIGRVGRGTDMDVIGIARGDSEVWRQLPDSIAAQADFKVNRLRVLIGERTLIGAIVMGDQTLSRPLHHMVVQQMDISAIRDQLMQPDAPVAEIIADFWSTCRERPRYAT
jgi:NAD(P)H-nitrite reductase large subunit